MSSNQTKPGGLGIVLLLSGCTTFVDAAIDQASKDLSCPASQISTSNGGGGRIVAQGCGTSAQYECVQTGTGPRCSQAYAPPPQIGVSR